MFDRISNQYSGSTVVVVGAGGIGAEIVRLVLPAAARVIVADFQVEALNQIQQNDMAGKLRVQQLDVRDSAAVTRFAQWIHDDGGAPHFLFYTAGLLTIEPWQETTPEAWRRVVDVNLNGAFYCTKAIADLMIPHGRGSILLLGSIAGTKARSGSRVNPVYNTTKAALAAMVNATAMQLRSAGVRINCISPGPTETPMMDIQPTAVHAAVRDITLDRRLNQPTEVAELALFVAAHGRFTGEDVPLGGGAGLGG